MPIARIHAEFVRPTGYTQSTPQFWLTAPDDHALVPREELPEVIANTGSDYHRICVETRPIEIRAPGRGTFSIPILFFQQGEIRLTGVDENDEVVFEECVPYRLKEDSYPWPKDEEIDPAVLDGSLSVVDALEQTWEYQGEKTSYSSASQNLRVLVEMDITRAVNVETDRPLSLFVDKKYALRSMEVFFVQEPEELTSEEEQRKDRHARAQKAEYGTIPDEELPDVSEEEVLQMTEAMEMMGHAIGKTAEEAKQWVAVQKYINGASGLPPMPSVASGPCASEEQAPAAAATD